MLKHDHLQSLPLPKQYLEELGPTYRFADRAHEGQTRKLTGEDYVVHPVAVTGLTWLANRDIAALQGALLHDTVEDTDVTIEDIRRRFGREVAMNVWGVTKDSSINGWRQKNEAWLHRFGGQAPSASVDIGTADKVDNLGGTIDRFRERGPVIWEQFTGTPEDYLWWYTSVLAIAKRRAPNSTLTEILDDKVDILYVEVFKR